MQRKRYTWLEEFHCEFGGNWTCGKCGGRLWDSSWGRRAKAYGAGDQCPSCYRIIIGPWERYKKFVQEHFGFTPKIDNEKEFAKTE